MLIANLILCEVEMIQFDNVNQSGFGFLGWWWWWWWWGGGLALNLNLFVFFKMTHCVAMMSRHINFDHKGF